MIRRPNAVAGVKLSRLDPRSNFSQLDNDVLLNSAEASSVLSVSINTLKSWKKDDKGPPTVKLGRSVRYAAGDLREWIAARRRSA